MLYSRTPRYAIQALVYMARKPGLRTTAEIAAANDIPLFYLTKILGVLVKRRLLSSHKGTSGGYQLALDPGEIRLIDIVEALDEADWCSRCAMGYPACRAEDPCPLHYTWAELRASIRQCLEKINIQSLLVTDTATVNEALGCGNPEIADLKAAHGRC